jgi:prepilin peptidase CpaA
MAGAGVFLIFYLLGGMGGGDVKLMAGFGALLGAKRLCEAALWTAGCGGVMALAVIGAGLIRDFWTRGKPAGSQPGPRADSIPYAPAIAAGVWLSLVGAT